MTNLGLNDRRDGERRDLPGPRRVRLKINWNAVGVITAIAVALITWFSHGMGEARNMEKRVTTLETQRQSDSDRLDRIENKIDRILERQQRR